MKAYFAPFAVAVLALAGSAGSARAQATDQLLVKVPYEFVVSGKTLPAGTYRINRINTTGDVNQLAISNVKGGGVLLIADETETASGKTPSLSFEEINGEHFLTGIETLEHKFAINVSKSEILEASAKSHANPAASGVSGTD